MMRSILRAIPALMLGLAMVGNSAFAFGPHEGPIATGDCTYRHYGQPDLFRQYGMDNNCGGVSAGLYPAPGPVPAFVGHTYYTYEPLYPHEMLYPHHRTYHRYYDGGRGLTRTSVRWMR